VGQIWQIGRLFGQFFIVAKGHHFLATVQNLAHYILVRHPFWVIFEGH
jgi:hypothetical protein